MATLRNVDKPCNTCRASADVYALDPYPDGWADWYCHEHTPTNWIIADTIDKENNVSSDKKWYTVDAVRRVYVEASSELDAEIIANKRFFDQEPDGEYHNQVAREGVWHLFEVGDETDALCVWNPYKKENN